jgi:hypothetical protein
MNQTPSLLKNSGARRSWVRFDLTGTVSNRTAIGARVTITAGGRKQMSEIFGGGSYLSQNEPALYFGLGDAGKVERVDVRWPNGGTQSWMNLEVNKTYKFTEAAK